MTRPIDEVVRQLQEAVAELTEAEKAYQEACHAHTLATNRVNFLQKELDQLVADMKKAAPRGTDWSVSRLAKGVPG
jgi:hypothetical protein